MAYSPSALFGPVQLGLTAAALITVPAQGKVILKRTVFTNVNASAQTITIHVVRSGGSVSSSNMIIDAMPLSSLQAYVAPELANLVLNGGDSLQALCSAATAVNAVGSGFAQ